MKKPTSTLLAAALAVAAGLAAAPASAQFAKAEDAVKYRQAAFTVMGAHFSRLGAMANGKVPFDAKAAQVNADVVASLADLPWAAYADGYEGGKTKREAWSEKAKFNTGAEKMKTELVKLQAAAKTGTLDSLKAAFGPAAGTCKACHDDFRNK